MENFSIFDSVMEAGDHFKSGASSKSRMSNCTDTQKLIMNVVQKTCANLCVVCKPARQRWTKTEKIESSLQLDNVGVDMSTKKR